MSTVQRAEPELIELTAHQDPRGSLVPLEETAEVPFTIRRVFIIVGVPRARRERTMRSATSMRC